jgi:uncharacterized membrane protein YciS (DUF1049 family)
MPKKTGLFLALTIICTIAALFTYGITLIGTILFGVFYFKRKKEYNNAQANCQKEIDEFESQSNNIKQQFLQNGYKLNGIYANNK